MKKYVIFLMLNLLVPFMVVNADVNPVPNECVDNNTCLTLCNYKTTLQFGGSSSSNYQKEKVNRDLTIYYNYNDATFTVKWQNTDKEGKVRTKTGAVNYVFSTSGNKVYWATGQSVSLANFTCPKYGYLDTSDMNSDNELCFDNDGTTCKNSQSNIGTAFGKHGGFVSTEKDLDFEEDISKYNIVADIEQDITNGTFNVKEDFVNKTMKDFQTNYLHGHDVPAFIANSAAYQNLETKAGEDYDAAKAKVLKKAEEEKDKALKEAQKAKQDETYYANKEVQIYCGNNDSISILRCEEARKKLGEIDDKYKQIVDNANAQYEQTEKYWEATGDEVSDQVGVAISNLNMKVDWKADFKVDSNCDSYLGNPLTPGKPAYYMQFIFNLMKYAAIILLFALSIVDFTKAITAGKDDALKKAGVTAVKRLIIVVIIFFLPNLIKFLLTLLGAYSPDTCGIS